MGNVEVIREALVLNEDAQSLLEEQSRANSPQCVLQWHLLCFVEVQDSSSGC